MDDAAQQAFNQGNLRANAAYQAAKRNITIDPITRLGARMTRANVAFDDHPNERRYTDHIDTVSAESVFDWLLREHRASSPIVVR